MYRFKAIVLCIPLLFPYLARGQADSTATNFIAEGDSAYQAFNNKAAAEFYARATEADPSDYQATWKLARAYLDIGESYQNKAERADYFKKGEVWSRKAIALQPDGEKGHLYLAIALGRVALDAGARERVQMSKAVKAEADTALQLDPNDDLAWHVLGRWNRKMATLSFIEKKFADLFLGGVPKGASLQNAVTDFQKAIELNPNFIDHHLQLGITYKDMGKKQLAAEQFKKVLEMPNKNWEDPQHKIEAEKLLKEVS